MKRRKVKQASHSHFSSDARIPSSFSTQRMIRRAVVSVGVFAVSAGTWLSVPRWAVASPSPEDHGASRWWQEARDSIHEFLFSKRVAIKGMDDNDESIRRALPEDRSVAWWLLNRSTIGAQLSMLPQVESAAVTSCAGEWSARCFEVHIQERKPTIVALVEDHAWLVGRDGGFVKPLPNVRSFSDVEEFVESANSGLIGVDGVSGLGGGLELIRGRLRYVTEVIETIEAELGLKVRLVTLEKNGEARVIFEGRPYPVLFGFSGSDRSSIVLEASRYKQLLSRLNQRDDVIKEVDLAFQKVAVIRLK